MKKRREDNGALHKVQIRPPIRPHVLRYMGGIFSFNVADFQFPEETNCILIFFHNSFILFLIFFS